jgi:hypothetical protein
MPLNSRLGGPLTEAGSLSPAEGLGVCLSGCQCEPETVTAILSGLGAPGLSAPVATGHTRAQAMHEGQEPERHCGAMGAQLPVSGSLL